MAPLFRIVTLLSFSLSIAAQGTQFITGTCASDTECASACCDFTTGKCAAPFVANENGHGCGFGNSEPNNNALNGGAAGNANANAGAEQANGTDPAAVAPPAAAAPEGAGAAAGAGTQFITGPCTSDADCAAGCCAFNTGKCAGPVIAQERDGGCGFGDLKPNDNAAKALQKRVLGRRGPAFM
ncbi:hypothetical protein T440DRAFT_475834 [Plenodomus tracheiphilus IPT5]|uniref:Biotrophy-associated secreted protein 2 n=1 Tax=Plenodomus tracheiphilus IPT5 TaxID=1408161 RepID=A0A6A7BJZ6_9PLEO|nr:hypothetical protein T440DRAFT_475834 [Plenodomus tracheiphilus IPT5]